MLEKLNNIGVARSVINGDKNSPLIEIFRVNLNKLVNEIKQSALNDGVKASNSLIQSIVIKTIEQQKEVDGIAATVTANNYWKFINFGVNGKFFNAAPNWESLGVKHQPFNELVESTKVWMPFKNIKPKDGQTFEQAAIAISKAVIRNGKEPRPFLTDAIKNTKTITIMSNEVAAIIGKSVAVSIKNSLQNGN